jgi:predicted PurR-regulated permease PerM
MMERNVEKIVFVVLLCAVTLTFFWLIRGFLQPIFWAIALGIVVYPLYLSTARRLNGRKSLAAFASVAVLVIVLGLPLFGLVAAVSREAAGLIDRLNAGDYGIDDVYARILSSVPLLDSLLARFGVDTQRLPEQLSAAAVEAGQFMAKRALAIGQDTVRVTVFFFLTLYLLFFFLRDGERLLDGLVRAFPLGDERERYLLRRFAEVSRATIKGTLVVGAVQGALGGIAFALLGIGAPVLWGVAMALASILPAVGPALVWLPAAILLLVNREIASGIVLIVVGVFVIGLVDNLLRPLLVGRDTRMPDYLVLLSTLGGLAAFGLAGIIVGPIIAALFVSVWQMAQQEVAPDPAAESAPSEPKD